MTLSTLWNKLLSHVIPRGLKRTMVLVAVFVEAEKTRGESSPRLNSLNARLHLAGDEVLLQRVAELNAAIFRRSNCPVRKDVGIIENCSNVIRWLPTWLWYGSRSEILSDLAEVTACNIDQPA